MSEIRPFRAYRPHQDLVARVAAPPYDVISSDEARVLAKDNDISFLHINKPEIDLPWDIDLYDDRVYETGLRNLKMFIHKDILFRESIPLFYIYQQKMGAHIQSGVVAACSCQEYADGLIKRHEFTRKDKEDDRTRHTSKLNANAGPVFLTYRERPEIDRIVERVQGNNQPIYNFTAPDGIGHTVWRVPQDLNAQLIGEFAKVPATYVADGHHRAASAARVGLERKASNPHHQGDEPYNYFMAVLFPKNQLKIMDYNRVVKDLNGKTSDEFLLEIAQKFAVSHLGAHIRGRDARPTQAGEISMYLGGQWYRLQARPGTYPAEDPVRSLDVSILQENLLAPVLGIQDPRTDKRIDFVGGIRGLTELEKRCWEGCAVAFALFPTTLDQLLSVSDAGEVMPPKSTWFEPKLRSGILVRDLTSW